MISRKFFPFFIILLILFTFIGQVSALDDPTQRYCINSTHLFEEKYTKDNQFGNHILNETTVCPFGCSNSDCYEPYDVPFEIFVAAAFFCGFIAFMFAYLTVKMGNSGDKVLPILFIVLSLVFSMLGIFVMTLIGANNNLDSISGTLLLGLQVLTWSLIVIIFYMIISYMISVLGGMGRISGRFRKKKHKTGEY